MTDKEGPQRIFKGLGPIHEMVKGQDTNYPVILAVEKGRSAFVRSVCLGCLSADVSTHQDFTCPKKKGQASCGGKVVLIHKEYPSASFGGYRLAMQKVNEEVHKIQTDELYRNQVIKLMGEANG